MAVAGKVAITLSTENGGAWSADVTYDRLVAVKHNNNLYISRKTVTNVEPPNDEFWFLALEGYSGADVQELINRMNEFANTLEAIITGTQQVGNAKTLDGHGAEYFAPLADLERYMATLYEGNTEEGIDAIYDSLHTNASNGEWYRARVFHNVSHSVLGGGTWYVEGYRQQEKYGWQSATCYHSGNIVKTFKRALINSTAWSNWIDDATTADLAKYLPLTGGTVESSSIIPFGLKHLGEYGQYIAFSNNLGKLGHLGIDANKKPYFKNAEETANYEILHTGNKPTGTYTGNGSATERQINVGGTGIVIYLRSSAAADFIVGYHGAFGVAIDGTPLHFSDDEIYFRGGVINVATTNNYLNGSGVVNTYNLL